MKIYLIATLLTIFGTGRDVIAGGEVCPAEFFDVHFSFFVDEVVPIAEASTLDSELHHFRETLKLSDKEIDEFTAEVIAFYNETYGLDFSESEPNAAGERAFENAVLFPFEAPLTLTVSVNRFLVSGRKGSNRCFSLQEGGYDVRFTGEQRFHGTYGGEEGRVEPAEQISYTLLRFNFCQQELTIIRCIALPTYRSPDGYAPRVADCFNRQLGHGLLQGSMFSGITKEDPSMLRVISRQIVSFPGTLV